jgi:hypothetical protein
LSPFKRIRTPGAPQDKATRGRARTIGAGVLTAAAALLVFAALVVPDSVGKPRPGSFLPYAFVGIPLEGILGATLLIVLPPRPRRWAATLLGFGLGVLTSLKLIDIGFLNVLGRRFDPVLDWPLFHDGFNALTETNGRPTAIAAVIGAVLLAVAILALLTLACLRLARLAGRHSGPARRTVVAVMAAWMVFAVLGTSVYPGVPIAGRNTAKLARATALKVPAAIRDGKAFEREAAADAFAGTPDSRLLEGLRGKDVVIGVVESYGRAALENRSMRAVVEPALDAGAQQLAAAGFSARSGFLTSSTYGGGSWLAHASIQSGLWIDNQQRYRQLVSGKRLTITNAFHRAGWRTVGVEPGNTVAWPEAKFYGYDDVWDSRNLGYEGPRFGWSRMPDQYTLKAFQDNVYAKAHGPLMAEITLTSSHEPWTPVPQLVDWDSMGTGAVFGPQAQQGEKRSVLWKDPARTKIEYAKSIGYSVQTLTSWAARYGNDDLVLVFFGDHQAVPIVSGRHAGHDVPITIVAKDRSVLDRIAGWGWEDGLKPSPKAPVWKMSQFRDKFLTAFGAPDPPTGKPH